MGTNIKYFFIHVKNKSCASARQQQQFINLEILSSCFYTPTLNRPPVLNQIACYGRDECKSTSELVA